MHHMKRSVRTERNTTLDSRTLTALGPRPQICFQWAAGPRCQRCLRAWERHARNNLKKSVRDPPQHGLSSNTMALITSDCGKNALPEHQMARNHLGFCALQSWPTCSRAVPCVFCAPIINMQQAAKVIGAPRPGWGIKSQ